MKKRCFRKGALQVIVLIISTLLISGMMAQKSFGLETFVASKGLAVAGQQLGASAALKTLDAGGNAVDAMITLFSVLTVTKPDMVSPAGGGWALIYMAKKGEVVALDMDSVAPAAATPEALKKAFKDADWSGPRTGVGPMVRGPYAAGVPGTLKGWEAMLKRFGTMSFAQVLKPAIDYAENGVAVDARMAFFVKAYIPELSVFPSWTATYTVKGNAPKLGEKLYNKNLANTYRKIAKKGADVVYKGELADDIAKTFKSMGGWITKKDLADYKVKWSAPLKITYTSSSGEQFPVYGNQPPSSSLEVLETLKILSGTNLKALGHNSVEYLHLVTEASKIAHVDGYKYNGDPAFVKVPVEKLLSDEYAKEARASIDPNKAQDIKTWPVYPTDKKTSQAPSTTGQTQAFVRIINEGATTHSIVVDKWGNAVTMTNTIGTFYGAGFPVGKTGMCFGNGIDWMDIDVSPWTNEKSALAIEPGKRNRWTLAPIMVFKNGKPLILTGGSGAETTAQGIVQPILNVIEFGMDMQKAIDAPRFRWGDMYHYTGGTDLWLEGGIPDNVRQGLEQKGHKVVPRDRAGAFPPVGGTNAIMILPDTKAPTAGFNTRPGSSDWAIGN